MGCALFVDQHPPQAEARPGRPGGSRARSGGTGRRTPWRQLAAVLAGHGALDALDDGGAQAAVVLELLGAVVHLDARVAADVLVVGALVGVLEPAPAADVVDQDDLEVGAAALDVARSAA